MNRLLIIDFDKKLSIFSILFMFITIVLIYIIAYYYASFNLSYYEILEQNELLKNNYITDTFQVVEVIGVIFVIFLVELELFNNIDNFDAYFISITSKKKVFAVKIFNYLSIIFIYILYIYIGIVSIYILRFKDIEILFFESKLFISLYIYLIFIFMIAYLLLLAFYNYFTAIVVFVMYWCSKLFVTTEFDKIFKVIFFRLEYDLNKYEVAFTIDFIYIIVYIIVVYFICRVIYLKKDLKLKN